MRKTVVTFGLISGAMLATSVALIGFFHDAIPLESGMIVGYTAMVLAFLMVYFGVRSYRDNVLDGRISFGRAFGAGLLITLIACACYVVTWEIVFFNFMPDFLDKYTAQMLEQMRQEGTAEAVIAARAKEMAEMGVKYRNPLYNAAVTLLEPLPVGLLFTLVSAGLVGPLARKRGAS